MLAGGAVPSVAIITPTGTLTQDVADAAKEAWLNKFGGPVREPVILPNGTQVIPLAWSPSDTQLIEGAATVARRRGEHVQSRQLMAVGAGGVVHV